MKKKLYNEIEIPQETEVEINENIIKIKGPEGENSREFNLGKLKLEKKDNKIIIGHDKATKIQKKRMNTITKHIQNMINGVNKKFEYQLKICSSHFPMNVSVENNKLIIKNFIGEKIQRSAEILNGVEIDIQKEIITLKSFNKELAGQTAANIEKATKIRNKDRRIFQDGIYLIEKSGKKI